MFEEGDILDIFNFSGLKVIPLRATAKFASRQRLRFSPNLIGQTLTTLPYTLPQANETYENVNEEVGEWEETGEAENDLDENEPRFVAIG